MSAPSSLHEAARIAAWNRLWATLLSPPRDTTPKPAPLPRPDDPDPDDREAA
jgi:hypothetical protein